MLFEMYTIGEALFVHTVKTENGGAVILISSHEMHAGNILHGHC